MDARPTNWDDAYNILLVIEVAFRLYAMHRRPLPACHKDTIKRLAEAYRRLTREDGRES